MTPSSTGERSAFVRPQRREVPLASVPVLKVEGLSKSYHGRAGTKVANDRIDLVVRPGEIVALLGPNGAGKTTLLRQVAGQLVPSSGRVEVNGIDMVRHPLRAKQAISVIPQECEPKRDLTVEEHVRFFALLKGDRADVPAEVERLLDETGLTEHRRKLVRELSGGLRRRVLIAVALTGQSTRLLLLDEPTTGVDPEARRSVWRLIDRLRERNIGILLTTHYIEEAEYLADRVVIVNDGRSVAEGTVEEIRNRLPYRGRLEIRGLDHLTADADAAVRSLEQKYRVGFQLGNSERLEIPDPFHNSVVEDLALLTRHGVAATLSPVSLEDAYLAMVGAAAENGGT
jgi:ABC-2 type transport system ATP-binding protein